MPRPTPRASRSTRRTSKQIREAIAGAPAHGLKPDLFLKGGESGDGLAQAALKYASALANGYSDPTKLHEVYTIPRSKTDVRAGLQQALQNGNVGEWLNSLAPQTDEYKALSRPSSATPSSRTSRTSSRSRADKPIKPGARDPRIPAIVAVLRVGRLCARAASKRSSRPRRWLHAALVAAVKQFQADSGAKPDGILGKETIGALSTGPGDRARQLAVAMERLRWLQRDPPKTRIDVNTAASFLDYWRDGQHVDHRKVINGEADKPTPQLQAPIYRLVANPTWTVPKGIAAKELAEKRQAWLADNDYVMKDGKWVQQSGPKNSLGLVKFDMQDDEAIYLHDTPAKAVFAHARPASQPRLREGRECGPVRDRAGPAGRHPRPVPEGDAEGRRNVRQAAERNPGPAALSHRLLGRLAHPVPSRRLRLGRKCRQGAGARTRSAAARSSSPRAATTSARKCD